MNQINDEHLIQMFKDYTKESDGGFYQEYKPINPEQFEKAEYVTGLWVFYAIFSGDALKYTGTGGFFDTLETAKKVLTFGFKFGYQSPIQWHVSACNQYHIGYCNYMSTAPYNKSYDEYFVISAVSAKLTPQTTFHKKHDPQFMSDLIKRDAIDIDKYIIFVNDAATEYELHEIGKDELRYLKTCKI